MRFRRLPPQQQQSQAAQQQDQQDQQQRWYSLSHRVTPSLHSHSSADHPSSSAVVSSSSSAIQGTSFESGTSSSLDHAFHSPPQHSKASNGNRNAVVVADLPHSTYQDGISSQNSIAGGDASFASLSSAPTDEEMDLFLASKPTWKLPTNEYNDFVLPVSSMPSGSGQQSTSTSVLTVSAQHTNWWEAPFEPSSSLHSASAAPSSPHWSSMSTPHHKATLSSESVLDSDLPQLSLKQKDVHLSSIRNNSLTATYSGSTAFTYEPSISPRGPISHSNFYSPSMITSSPPLPSLSEDPNSDRRESLPSPLSVKSSKQMRVHHSGSSSSSFASIPSGTSGPVATRSGRAASTSTTSQILQANTTLTATRPRAGTIPSISSHSGSFDFETTLSPSSSAGTMNRIYESTAMDFHSETGIPTSLSAELAGLGLDVSDFKSDLLVEDVDMRDSAQAFDMERTSSSSTTRGKRAQDSGDVSFLSQTTSSMDSSGLDDSLFSSGSNNPRGSRWVHGKDTPPSSPAPSLRAAVRPSPVSDFRSGTLLQTPSGSPYSQQADQFGVKGQGRSSPNDWSRTWPRGAHSQTGAHIHTPMHHSRSENTAMQVGLSPPTDLRQGRPLSAHSTQSLQERRIKRNSRGLVSGSPLQSVNSVGSGGMGRGSSNESLRSDIGPSRTTRLGAEAIQQRRMKRMSASFVSEQEARRMHQEKQKQYDQVSDALDTLRRFLRQREGSNSLSSSPSKVLRPRPTSYAGAGLAGVPSLDEQISSLLASSSSSSSSHQQQHQEQQQEQQRTLRHPPIGPLPPRGSVYGSSSASMSSSQSISSHQSASVEAERIAALEDLARKVRQMKDDNQRILDDL